MPDVLDRKERTARKRHTCNYCEGYIEKDEKYEWSKLKYDDLIYEWKAHKECALIASEIWDYVDPDDGMTHEDFMEGAENVCQTFICPDCKDPAKDDGGCRVCLHKLYDLFLTHTLQRCRNGYAYEYKTVLRK